SQLEPVPYTGQRTPQTCCDCFSSRGSCAASAPQCSGIWSTSDDHGLLSPALRAVSSHAIKSPYPNFDTVPQPLSCNSSLVRACAEESSPMYRSTLGTLPVGSTSVTLGSSLVCRVFADRKAHCSASLSTEPAFHTDSPVSRLRRLLPMIPATNTIGTTTSGGTTTSARVADWVGEVRDRATGIPCSSMEVLTLRAASPVINDAPCHVLSADPSNLT